MIIKILLPVVFAILLSLTPVSFDVIDSLHNARTAYSDQNMQEQAKSLRQVIIREPWRIWLWEEIGMAELKSSQLLAAKEAFLKASENRVLSPEGWYQLGEVYYQLEDVESAQKTWQSLLQSTLPLTDHLRTQTFERLVQLQRDNGDLINAVETLKAWIEKEPTNSRANFYLGLYLSVIDPEQALPILIHASSLDTKYTSAVQKIRRGMGQGSEVDDPSYTWLMIGRALGSIGYWDLAEKALQNAVSANPQYAEAWAFLGEAQTQMGLDGNASFQRALELDPQSVTVRAILAMQYRRAGDYDQALAYLEAVVAREPDEPLWQVELGNIWVEKGDLPVALLYFQKAIQLAPDSSLYYQYLNRFSVQYDMDVETIGLPAARQAVILAPDDPGALDAIGWTMVYLSDYASAERFLQQALEKDATYSLALLHLGQLYIQMQNFDQAQDYLQRASDLAGEDAIGVIARRLLTRYY